MKQNIKTSRHQGHGKGGYLWVLLVFDMLVFLSCGEDQGNYTAVNQHGVYLYGVWNAYTAREAKQLVAQIAQSGIKETPRPKPLPTVTTASPTELLPTNVEDSYWVRSRDPSEYMADNLYKDVIGGNPELFQAYGFIEQANVEYQTPRLGSKSLVLAEIFDMGSVENAYGIYSFNRYPQDEFEWVGNRAMTSGKNVMFWKGKYFVQIEGYEFAPAIKQGMIEIAKAVASRIKDPPTKPNLVEHLPKKGRILNSEKYFLSNSMLHGLHHFLSPDSLQLATNGAGTSAAYRHSGASADLTDPMIAFILAYPSESEAESAYQTYQHFLEKKSLSVGPIKTGGVIARAEKN